MTRFSSKNFWIGIIVGGLFVLAAHNVLLAIQREELPQSPIGESGLVYENGLLSANLNGTNLKNVLGELARQTGIKVTYLSKNDEKISAHFIDLKPRDALKEILRSSNYVLVFKKKLATEADLPSEIHILSPGSQVATEPLSSFGSTYKSDDPKLEKFTIKYPTDAPIGFARWDSEGTASESTYQEFFEIQFNLPYNPMPIGFTVSPNPHGLSLEDWVASEQESQGLDYANTIQTVWTPLSINGYHAYAFYNTREGYAGNGLAIYLSHGKFIYSVGESLNEEPVSLENTLPYQILSSIHFNN